MSFDVTEEERGDAVIVRFNGQFDFSHVAVARSIINRRVEAGARLIIVNLDGLDYIDSAGLGVLVGTLARLREREGELAVVCHSPRIRRVFDITKLTQLLTMYDDEESALSHGVT
ncbi:MAG TPA: STAS domain-containing protein [Armatimonadota bacterium]|jgi:anti-anti-sigma factor